LKSEMMVLCNKKESLFKSVPIVLSFFEKELLLTTITSEKQKELVEKKKNEVKEAGKGLLKRAFAGINALNDYAKKLEDMTKEEILKENTTNIQLSDINSIKFKKSIENYDLDTNSNSSTVGKIIIKTANEKIKFTHKYEDLKNEKKKFFKNLL